MGMKQIFITSAA